MVHLIELSLFPDVDKLAQDLKNRVIGEFTAMYMEDLPFPVIFEKLSVLYGLHVKTVRTIVKPSLKNLHFYENEKKKNSQSTSS